MNKKEFFQNIKKSIISIDNDPMRNNDSVIFDRLNYSTISLEVKNDFSIAKDFDTELLDYLSREGTVALNFFTLDSDNNITRANDNAVFLLLGSNRMVPLTNFTDYIAEDSIKEFLAWVGKISIDRHMHSCHIVIINSKKTIIHLDLIGKKIKNPINGINEILIIAVGKSIDNDHLNSYRYDQKSIFNAKVAHELFNPLSVVLNYTNGCIRKIESNDYDMGIILAALKECVRQSVRSNEIILSLKNMNFGNELSLTSVSLSTFLEKILYKKNFICTEFNIPFSYRGCKLPTVNVDECMLEYVIYALVKNSVESLLDSQMQDPKIIIETNQINKNSYELCIQDNGPGILSEDLEHLYEPHFTTKAYAAGMGLTICCAIIKAHKGTMSMASIDGHGSCVSIQLPF